MYKSYKILLGVCTLCGIGSLYYLYKVNRDKNRSLFKDSRSEDTTHEEKPAQPNEENIDGSEETIKTNLVEKNAIIVFKKTSEDLSEGDKQSRAEKLKEDLERIGFKNLQVLLSKNLTATGSSEQLEELQKTRSDLSILWK